MNDLFPTADPERTHEFHCFRCEYVKQNLTPSEAGQYRVSHLCPREKINELVRGTEPSKPNNPTSKDLRLATERWLATPQGKKAYWLFKKFAAQMVERDRSFGIGLLAERVRWEMALAGQDEEGFKINNNYRAYIARKLCDDVVGVFERMRFRETRY